MVLTYFFFSGARMVGTGPTGLQTVRPTSANHLLAPRASVKLMEQDEDDFDDDEEDAFDDEEDSSDEDCGEKRLFHFQKRKEILVG